MAATLEELRDSLLPGARTVSEAAHGPGERDIAWVRVMRARVPAFDALDPGDLAILPASAVALVAPAEAEVRALVEACAEAGVAGLVLVDAEPPATPDPLPVLERTARDAGLAAVRLPPTDVAALERSVIGFLVNRRAELDRQAAILEARLESLAIEGVGPAGLVAAIAGSLGRAVALEGRRGDPLAVHAPPEVADAPAAVARYHANPRAVALRVGLPAAGGPAGSLALLGERPATDRERVIADRLAGLLALELARDEAVRRARDGVRRSETLPTAGPPWVVAVARQRVAGAPDTVEAREATRREIRQLAPARRMALRGDAESLELRAVLAVDGEDPAGTGLAGRIAGLLGRTVAVSRPFGVPAERPAAEAEARTTLEAAGGLAEPPAVARADRLAAYRLLGNLHNVPDGARDAHALLEPLLVGRPDVRREHLATLRAVLDHPGLAEAAAALGVHRNTVAYRVRRIEALTGWRLADPDLRLPIALALRLVQTAPD